MKLLKISLLTFSILSGLYAEAIDTDPRTLSPTAKKIECTGTGESSRTDYVFTIQYDTSELVEQMFSHPSLATSTMIDLQNPRRNGVVFDLAHYYEGVMRPEAHTTFSLLSGSSSSEDDYTLKISTMYSEMIGIQMKIAVDQNGAFSSNEGNNFLGHYFMDGDRRTFSNATCRHFYSNGANWVERNSIDLDTYGFQREYNPSDEDLMDFFPFMQPFLGVPAE